MTSRLLGTALVLASLMAPAAALAQSADNKAAAQALFDDGRKLMDQGKFAEACKKLENSQKLDPGAGTLLNLAACYEKNGQTASAWVTYKDAATASQDRHPDWMDRATKKAAELEPSLAKLTIVVTGSIPGLDVKSDGMSVGAATFGTALPIDPGQHVIEARAPGRADFQMKVTIKNKDSQTVTVPALAETAGGPGPAKSKTQLIAGGVVTGVGAAGLVVGAIFGFVALGKKSDAAPSCSSDYSRCNDTGLGLVHDAEDAGTISTVALIAGGVVAVTGIVVMLTAPKGSREKQPPAVSLTLRGGAGASPAGVTLGGTF